MSEEQIKVLMFEQYNSAQDGINKIIDRCIQEIRKNPCAIKYIRKPSEVIYMAAIEKNPDAFQYIKNPAKKFIYWIKFIKN